MGLLRFFLTHYNKPPAFLQRKSFQVIRFHRPAAADLLPATAEWQPPLRRQDIFSRSIRARGKNIPDCRNRQSHPADQTFIRGGSQILFLIDIPFCDKFTGHRIILCYPVGNDRFSAVKDDHIPRRYLFRLCAFYKNRAPDRYCRFHASAYHRVNIISEQPRRRHGNADRRHDKQNNCRQCAAHCRQKLMTHVSLSSDADK